MFLIGQAVAAATGALLVAVGVFTLPGAVFAASAAAFLVGPVTAIALREAGHRCRTAVRVGVAAAAGTMAAMLATAGLVVVLGAMSALVIPLVLAAVGAWGWRHRRALRDRVRALGAGHDTTVSGHRAPPDRAGAHPGAAHGGPSPLVRLPQIQYGTVSTAELRAAWQRSYWLLRDLPSADDRCTVVGIRQGLLDELERRDPIGFGKWLQTDPRAGSDPGRYLTADR